jgi:signal transduction histidine kinase
MQTAVTPFQRNHIEAGSLQQIELHAQLHFGQDSYFNVYNLQAFNEAHNAVLFELLLDEQVLDTRGIEHRPSKSLLTYPPVHLDVL